MKNLNLRFAIAAISLFICSAVLTLYQLSEVKALKTVDLSNIPDTIEDWKSKTVPVDKKIVDILQTPSVLIKEYYNSAGDRVYLTIVYYKANRVEFHSPERCAVGAGSYISEARREDIFDSSGNKFINVNKLIVKGEHRAEVILYYFESEGFATGSYPQLRWHMIINKLKNKPNSGALIKFSSSTTGSLSNTEEQLKKFMLLIGPLLSKCLSN